MNEFSVILPFVFFKKKYKTWLTTLSYTGLDEGTVLKIVTSRYFISLKKTIFFQ